MNTLTHYEKIILYSINLEDYKHNCKDLKQVIDKVHEIFTKVYVHNNNKHLPQNKVFKEWLQGLPSVLTVPFYNAEILESALLWGFDVSTEEKEDEFLKNYWITLSNEFFNVKENL